MDEPAQQPRKPSGPFRAIYALISYSGEHPFATGLFAIVGVAGFVFSIYTFALDQNSARLSAEQSSRIEDQGSRIEAEVADSGAKVDELGKALDDIREKVGSSRSYPKMEHIWLEDDVRRGEFGRFLGENENGIVYISVGFPASDDKTLAGMDDEALYYRQKHYIRDDTADYVCWYYRFLNNDTLSDYVEFGSGSWMVTGYFKVGISRDWAAAPDCMLFSRDLTPVPLTSPDTAIFDNPPG